MNFELNEDQRAFADAVARIAAHHRATPAVPERLQHAGALEQDLREAGLFEAVQIDELGPVAAATLVMMLSELPVCAELAASALLAPWLCPGLPGPVAVLEGGAPARFLPMAKTVLRIGAGPLAVASIAPGDVQPLDSLFAYPMGRVHDAARLPWQPLDAALAPRAAVFWQIGLAAEIAGSLAAGLDCVLAHVKERRQFGRPLGSFQAVQHRLAECAVQTEAVKWLTLRAASTLVPLDAALALGHAQQATRRVAYDLHQFMGAMGLTLEHPLHRYTYRAKWLASAAGGAEHRFAAAAQAAWPPSLQRALSEELSA